MRWYLVWIVFLFCSCSDGADAPDVSGITVDVSIQRFDKDFFSMDTANMQAGLQALEKKYSRFLPVYFQYFAPVRDMAQQQNISFEAALPAYFRFIQPLATVAAQKFPDLRAVEKGLEDNLRYVKHYFPGFTTPTIIASVESLNPENPNEIYGTTYYEGLLIISLQMFLGKNDERYNPQFYPDYLRRRFEPEYMVPNAVRAIVGELYPDSSQSASLVEQMIEKGKQWWLLKKLLPHTPDSLITGYTAQQTKDLQREEGNIWGVISRNENLFSVEPTAIQTYIGEAPFTATLPQGAPGNIGPWIGWRIIEKFARENDKLTVQQVLRTPAKKIFEGSKYKPR